MIDVSSSCTIGGEEADYSTPSQQDICLCTQNGQLTERSQKDLKTALDRMGTGGLIGTLLKLLGQTLDGLSTLLFGNANTEVRFGSCAYPIFSALTLSPFAQLLRRRATCDYPANSIPVCGGTCTFACATGYKRCGNQCIANDRACVSNIPAPLRRRKTICEGTKVSCPVFGRGKTSFECVDIANRLESCGGCISAGQGRDCSEIHGADQVSVSRSYTHAEL